MIAGFHYNRPVECGLIPSTRVLLARPPVIEVEPKREEDKEARKVTYRVGRAKLILGVMTTSCWLSLRQVYDLVSPFDFEISLSDVAHYLERLRTRGDIVARPTTVGTKRPFVYRKADAKVSK